MSDSGDYYEDPRYSSSQGRFVGGGDAGGTWQALSMAAPLGQYEGSGDAGGMWREFTPEETAAAAARIEANRISDLEYASGILADNPLSVNGDQIQTRYGDVNVSRFNPIADNGQPITGDTAAQLVDPQTGVPIFLSNPDDKFSYTYDNTGTPAISGTVAQRAALYRPYKDSGPFGTILSDLSDAAKDPYFHKFLAASAAIAGGGLALNSAYGVGGLGSTGGLTAGSLGAAEAFPVVLGDSIVTSGAGVSGSTAGGFLGGSGDILAGAAGTGGGDLGASSLLSSFGNVTPSQVYQAARYAAPVISAITGSPNAAKTNTGSGSTNIAGNNGLSQMFPLNQQYLSTGAAPITNISGLIDYKPLAFSEAGRYANFSDIKPLSYLDKSPFQSGLYAAHGGHIKESMVRHPELNDVDPRLMSMIMQSMAFQDGGKTHVPEFITGATGHYVKGKGDGQSDDIPAMLADGEFVWDADTVAQLGNGSSDAGAKFLDKFREAVRAHKRSAPNNKIPPKASPLQYVKEAMKNTEKE